MQQIVLRGGLSDDGVVNDVNLIFDVQTRKWIKSGRHTDKYNNNSRDNITLRLKDNTKFVFKTNEGSVEKHVDGKIFTGKIPMKRHLFSADVLKNNKILITGGAFYDNQRCEILFHPDTLSFFSCQHMKWNRLYHSAILLSNGKVLVSGGKPAYDFEYDEEINKVIILDGHKSGAISYCEEYDPDTNEWQLVDQMLHCRQNHKSVLLDDNTVMVIGGDYQGSPLDTCEYYDIKTKTWSAGPKLPFGISRFDISIV